MSNKEMSLREEIKTIIAETREINEVNTSSYITHLIIKVFEKRIDSMFRTILEDVSKDMTKEQMNYIEPRFLTVFEKQKKELLK